VQVQVQVFGDVLELEPDEQEEAEEEQEAARYGVIGGVIVRLKMR
jgi:hypothetical protein